MVKCTGCASGTGPEPADLGLVPAAQLAAEGFKPCSGPSSMLASLWRSRERGPSPQSAPVCVVCRCLCRLRHGVTSVLWRQAWGTFTWCWGVLGRLTGRHVALLWTGKPLESAEAPASVYRCCEQGFGWALRLGVGGPGRRLRASPGLAPSMSDLAQGL